MAAEQDDIRDVYGAEKRRGRRFVDERQLKEDREIREALKTAIRHKDERAFLSALRRYGVKDGTDEFANALRAFRAIVGLR